MFDNKSTIRYVIFNFRKSAFPFGEKVGKLWKIHYDFHKILILIRKEQKCIVKDGVKIRRAYTLYIIKLIRQTNSNRNLYTLFEDDSDNK